MQDFRNLLSELGCKDVATYIQSGNAVFNYPGKVTRLSESISDAVEKQFGFRPQTMLVSAVEFLAIAAANPFVAKALELKFVHICFLPGAAQQPNTERMTELACPSEQYVLTDEAFYLHAPDGIGRSKLASNVEKCLGVRTTARNARTVGKICEMVESLS